MYPNDARNGAKRLSNMVRTQLCIFQLSLLVLTGHSEIATANQTSSDKAKVNEATHETLNIEGWTVHLNRSLRNDMPKKTTDALKLMRSQLQKVTQVVPKPALRKLREVPIWVNPKYEGERDRAEYHPGAAWLRNNGRDPIMVKAVEVTNVGNFAFENKRMPYLMLHELAHAYHDRVLGFNEPRIKAAYEAAKKSGTYESVRRFTGRKMVDDKAYAITNEREYFAESTEAYFGKNDFYPFNRKELIAHDPVVAEVIRAVWNINED